MAKITIAELENTSRESVLIDVTEYEQYEINGGWKIFRKAARRLGEAFGSQIIGGIAQRVPWVNKRDIYSRFF